METVSGYWKAEPMGSLGRKMRKVRDRVMKKFKSAEGMTILVALLFFMMCAVVGSIILTAATAASGRLSSLRKEEKGYYAAASVAQFLKDSIEGATFQISQTGDQSPVYTVNGEQRQAQASAPRDALYDLLVSSADQTTGLKTADYTMTVKPSTSGSGDQNTINANIHMQCDDNYQITAVITVPDDTGSGTASGYALTLTLPSVVQTDDITENVENTTTTTTPGSTGGATPTTTGGATPTTPAPTGGAMPSPAAAASSSDETITTTVTTVNWSGGRITAAG